MRLNDCFISLLIMGFSSVVEPVIWPTTGLDGIPLSFVVLNVPPFNVITMHPDGNYTLTGSSRFTFAWLAKRLNFTMKYVLANESIISKYRSYYEVLTTFISKEEVFGSSIALIATPERKKIMDLTYFMWADSYVMVVPRPGEEPRYFAFIRPFQPIVWLLILITIVIVVGKMTLFTKIFDKSSDCGPSQVKRNVLRYCGDYVMYIVSTTMNQGKGLNESPKIGTRLSFMILVGVWLLVATVLVNSYSSTVISYLTVTKMKPHVNSLEELADQHDIGIVVWRDTDMANYIVESTNGKHKPLQNQLLQHPDRLAGSFTEVSRLLRTKQFALPFMKSFCDTFVVNEYRREGSCRFVTSDSLRMSGFWSIPLQKNNRFTWMFSKVMMELWETGLPFMWVKMNTPQAPVCFVKRQSQADSTRKQAIRLKDLTSAFLFLGIGFSLAFAAFSVEFFRGKRQTRLSNKPKTEQLVGGI